MAGTAFREVGEGALAEATAHPVAFPDLVYAHQRWRRSLRTEDGGAAERAFRDALARFELEHGRIINAYWCSNVASAVALSSRPAPRWLPWLVQPLLRFHRVSDWATKGQPGVAAQLHRCDELAVRAEHVLTGLRRNICMQLAMTAAAHVLSLVDAWAAHDNAANTDAAIEAEKTRLDEIEAYYREAANGQAQMVYFFGMAVSAVLLCGGIGGGLWLAVGKHDLLGALIAGGIGAVVSVIQRINTGTFDVEADVGRAYVFFLGALRPAIGAVFGMAVSLALTSGMLHLPGVAAKGDPRFAALLVVTFFAGFSERWAQDTLAASVPNAAKSRPKQKQTA